LNDKDVTVISRALTTTVDDATKIQFEDLSISSAKVHIDIRDALSMNRFEPLVNEVLGRCPNIRETKWEYVSDFRRA
jgi:hypothetical protein